MEFAVLGSLAIRSGGADIPLGAPKLRALLTALVLDVGRVVPAERLVDDLWGEDASPQAMVSLRSYVSNLRRLLPSPDETPLIATRGPGYVLEVDPGAIDAVRFERLAREGRELVAAGRHDDALEVLGQALALWRGPALVDVADEPFARAPAARLEELRVVAAEDRLDALLGAGRHAEVVAEAEALADTHPLRERVRGQLMLALHRSGRAADALAVHRSFREHLADELGLDPSAQLDALAEAILRREPALDLGPRAPAAQAPATVLVPPAAPAPAPPLPAADDDALVGRTSERARIVEAVARLADGKGGVLLVAGEPGIGKTALLRRLTAESAAARLPVAWGRCQESQGAPPFWPWVQVLRALAEPLDDDTLLRVTAGSAALVAHLVPEVAARLPEVPELAAGDPHAARFALQDAATTFLRRIAVGTGLVVVLDDLHWGDVSSLELASFVGAHTGPDGILLAISYRDTDAARSPGLDDTLAALSREPVATSLRLTGLGRGEVAELAAAVTGDAVPDDLADEMHRRAGGNPFFVRQLAQLRAESDDRHDADAVPVGVRHVIVQRLKLLPAEIRTTLDVASVFGQDVDARPLAHSLDLPLATVLDHLDAAAAHGLVEGTSGATGWRFVHALIRDTLYGELAPSRAIRLHAAAADALERTSPQRVGAIAEHLWQAADLVEPERPIHWLRAAADDALAVYAFEEGERYLRQVLHLLAHQPHTDAALELEVRVRLVQVLVGLHGWASDTVPVVAERARELAIGVGVAPELTSLWWSRWAFSMTRGELTDARTRSRELLDDVRDAGSPAEVAAGHIAVAYTDLFRAEPADHVRHHLDAAARAEAGANPDTLGLTPERLPVARRITVALLAAFEGDVELTRTVLDDAVAVARAHGTPFSEAYARMFGGFACAALDRPELAHRYTREGLEQSVAMGLEHLANLTIPTDAWASARLGDDPVAAAARITAAVDALVAAGHLHAVPQWRLLLAEVHALAGDVDAARAALADSREMSARIAEDVYRPQWERVEAVLEGAADSA